MAKEYKKALHEVETGLRAMPDNPHLIAERGLIRAEQGKETGRIPAPDVVAIQDDVRMADKEPMTHGMAMYVKGLVELDQRRATKAESTLHEAIKHAVPGRMKRATRKDLFRIALEQARRPWTRTKKR
jgi:hypothetical protein